MIAKPTTGNYEPSSFLSKAIIKIECQTKSDWVKFLDKKSVLQFNGTVIGGSAHLLY